MQLSSEESRMGGSSDSLDSPIAHLNQSLSPQLDFQPIFAQFQSRYPMGGLVTELLQIHEGNYVVRALVQVNGVTLTTGMAIADAIELAEDRARLRALALIGIKPDGSNPISALKIQPSIPDFQIPLATTQVELPRVPIGINLPQTEPLAEVLAPMSTSPLEQSPTPTLPVTPFTPELTIKHAFPGLEVKTPAIELPPLDEPILPDAALESVEDIEPQPELEATPTGNGNRNSSRQVDREEPAIPAEVTPSHADPIDFSDPISQIDTEMMRVGWSKEQGRDYLKKRYKKRSRQQLSDEELLDFLSHLKSQPSAGETPF